MNALNGQQINSLIKSCVDEKALNSIIVNFNMNAKTKPREINKMLLLNEKFKKLFGEVFTPIPLVEEMLDKLPKEVWKDKNLKWVDPSCGTCNFLLVIKERLMESLIDIIDDKEEREKWILEQMLYGVDIQERNVVLSKLRLDPYNKYKLHIEAHDSLSFDFWRLNPDRVIIVGNPPYNDEKNKSNNTVSIYPLFVEKAIGLTNKFVLMITPSRWFFATSHNDHRKKMIYNYGLKHLTHFENHKFFGGTDIKGGLSYFVCQKGYNGECEFSYNGQTSNRNFKKSGHIFLDIRNENIAEKVVDKINKSNLKLSSAMYVRNGHINTNDQRLTEDDSGIPCFASKNRKLYVQKNNIDLNAVNYGKYKAINQLAQGVGQDIISDFIFCDKSEIANSSFIAFPFDTEKETRNFINYMSLKPVKFLVALRKSTQAITSTCFDYVPVLWEEIQSDKDYYEYFDLSKKEIELIEEFVK